MGSREIFALRKQGRSDEALEMARAEFPENKDDIWFLRAYAWPIYDRAKALVERYETKQLPASKLFGEFESYMNEFADMADPLRGDLAFSHMLRLAGKVSKDWRDFLLFARWAGLDSFSEDDEKPFVTEDGRTVDSLKARFTRAICCETAARAKDGQTDPELIEWGEGILAQALEAHPDDQWLNYYQSRLHLKKGEQDLALKRLMPVLRRQARAPWPWGLLGQILETTRQDDALVCLIQAVQLAREEQQIAQVRIRLASLLARQERFDEAAKQVELAARYRAENKARVPQALQQLLASDWYKLVEAAGSFRQLPKVGSEARKLLQSLDQQDLTYTLAVIDNINGAKALSYAATGADSGFVLLHKCFPEVAEVPKGAVIEVGHAGTEARDWRPSAVVAIPKFYEVIAGTLERPEHKPFAFIRSVQGDVFVPPLLAQQIAANQSFQVVCKAIWRKNKSGKIGWCALKVDGGHE